MGLVVRPKFRESSIACMVPKRLDTNEFCDWSHVYRLSADLLHVQYGFRLSYKFYRLHATTYGHDRLPLLGCKQLLIV